MGLARKAAVARAVTPGPGPAVKKPVAKAVVVASPGRRGRR